MDIIDSVPSWMWIIGAVAMLFYIVLRRRK